VDAEERGKVVELIKAVVAADHVVSDEERQFLRRIIERLGGTPTLADEEMATTDIGRTTATLRSLPPDSQTRVLALLVDAAIVDGRVEPEERALLLASAATLGVDAHALEERIARRLKSIVPIA
jgi:uncharacterized tellurite resistance protein B-like protein